MHEIYFVSHLAVHIDREQTSLFFGEVLCASQKNKKKQKIQRKKKLTLKGHKSFGSDALENLSSCAASTSILWLLIFFGLVRQTSHQPFEKTEQKTYEFLTFTRLPGLNY